VNALKQNLNSTRAEAQEFYDGYFAVFPKIYGYFEKVKQEAKERGYTQTLFGRRRNFPGLHSSLPQIKAMNERMAMNAPLQGTAADIVKLAMIEVDKILEKNNWRGQAELLLQVHDELIYEVKKELVDEVKPLIKQAMENVLDNKAVPLEVHTKVGDNWGEAK
jgi:DNA polymerase-1